MNIQMGEAATHPAQLKGNGRLRVPGTSRGTKLKWPAPNHQTISCLKLPALGLLRCATLGCGCGSLVWKSVWEPECAWLSHLRSLVFLKSVWNKSGKGYDLPRLEFGQKQGLVFLWGGVEGSRICDWMEPFWALLTVSVSKQGG